MATAGSVGSASAKQSYLYVSWQAGTYNIAGNYTPINWQAGIYNGNKWYSNAVKIYNVYVGGILVFGGGTYSNLTSSGYYQEASGTVNIYHNPDGTMPYMAVSIAGWFYDYGNRSGSDYWSLPTIPRATQPSVSPTTVQLGNTVTISMPRASSSFTHNLTYSIGSSSGTIGTGLGTSISWTPPLSLASAITAKSGVITITCTTVGIGTKTTTLTVTLPKSNPTTIPTTVRLGAPVTINTNRISTTFTHSIQAKIGTGTFPIADNVGDSVVWTPPLAVADYIIGATGSCEIVCTTYNGSANLGDSSAYITLIVEGQELINQLLSFQQLSTTLSFEAERSSPVVGRVDLISENTQDAFEEIDSKIASNGRSFYRGSAPPLALYNLNNHANAITYSIDSNYACTTDVVNNILYICVVGSNSWSTISLSDSTIIGQQPFSWGDNNILYDIVYGISNTPSLQSYNAVGNVLTTYSLPAFSNISTLTAFSANSQNDKFMVAGNDINDASKTRVYVYNGLAITTSNIQNIANWTEYGNIDSQQVTNLWEIGGKFYGKTLDGNLFTFTNSGGVVTLSGVYNHDDAKYPYYLLNDILVEGVVNGDNVVGLYYKVDGQSYGTFKYSPDFYTSDTPTFTTVQINNIGTSVDRVFYDTTNNIWVFYGIGNANVEMIDFTQFDIYNCPNTMGASIDAEKTTISTEQFTSLVNIRSICLLASLYGTSNGVRGMMSNGVTFDIDLSQSVVLPTNVFQSVVSSGIKWIKVIKIGNIYIGLSRGSLGRNQMTCNIVSYSTDGIKWYGGYYLNGNYHDLILSHATLLLSGYSDSLKGCCISASGYSTGLSNTAIDLYYNTSTQFDIAASSYTVSSIATDDERAYILYSDSNDYKTRVVNVSFNDAESGVTIEGNITEFVGYSDNIICTASKIYYCIITNIRQASLVKIVSNSTPTIITERTIVVDSKTYGAISEYDTHGNTFYIIYNSLATSYDDPSSVVATSVTTNSILWSNGRYIYNLPLPSFSPVPFTTGYNISGIINNEVINMATNCGEYIYAITPSGLLYYSETQK